MPNSSPLYIITLKRDFPDHGLFRGDRICVDSTGIALDRPLEITDLPDELQVGVIAARVGLTNQSFYPAHPAVVSDLPARVASGSGARAASARLRLLP
jgi:hypothetical protein